MLRTIFPVLPWMLLAPMTGTAFAQDAKMVPVRCILQSRVAAATVRDDGRLYFRGEPDRRQSYIAVFKGGATCPGLNRFASVLVDTTGAGYCDGDKVRAMATPGQIPGPQCVIDHFIAFSGDVDDPLPPDPAPAK